MVQESTYAKGRVTRTRILAMASRIFAEKGYHRTSLQEVLGALGATKGAFYHHWSSKEELALEILERLREVYEGLLTPALESARTGMEMAEKTFQVYNKVNLDADFMAIRIFLTFLTGLSKEDEPKLYDIIQEGVQENYALWLNIVTRGQNDGSIRKELTPECYASLVNAAGFGMHLCESDDDISDKTVRFQHCMLQLLKLNDA